jgi:hypothetical protein
MAVDPRMMPQGAPPMTDPMGGGRTPPPMPDPMMAGATPPPPMEGGNIPPSAKEMPPEAQATLMRPSQEIQAVLLARLSSLSEDELRMLDQVITPEVINVVVKFLPELGEIIQAVQDMSPDGTMRGMSEPVAEAPMPESAMGGLG